LIILLPVLTFGSLHVWSHARAGNQTAAQNNQIRGPCRWITGWIMQKDAAVETISGGNILRSVVEQEIEFGLLEEIRELAATHQVGPEAMAGAFQEAVLEIGRDKHEKESPADERRGHLIGLIFWKLFARGQELWITSKTDAGNAVPLELLVTAYRLWRRARTLAAKHGVGSSDAAEILAHATHATADRLAMRRDYDRIRKLDSYLFSAFMYAVFRLSRKLGSQDVHFVQLSSLDPSDEGSFQRAMEGAILCHELLNVMPPRGKSAATARYLLGYDWPETAAALGSSVNAAQKAQSVGFKRALEICTREFRKVRRPGRADKSPVQSQSTLHPCSK
jgi:DNA-directed RNA polymerase specialized sigma24 family protein